MLKFEEVAVPQIWSKVSSFILLDLIGAAGSFFQNFKQGRAAIPDRNHLPFLGQSAQVLPFLDARQLL